MQLLLLNQSSLENNMKSIVKVSKLLNEKKLHIPNTVLILQDSLELLELKLINLEKRNVKNPAKNFHILETNTSQKELITT